MGLSHSEISGSKSVCDSPKPIAAYHVLHRLLTPSHPPQTLRSLTLCLFLELNLPVGQDCISFLKMLRLPTMKLSKSKKFFVSIPK